KTFRARFKKDSNGRYIVDPDGKPDFSQGGLEQLHNAVEGLASDYKVSGSPSVEFDLEGDDHGLTDDGGKKVHLNKTAIKNNYMYASTLFHEYRHCYQWITPYMGHKNYRDAWTELYGPGSYGEGGVNVMKEYDAYAHQYRM